MQNPNRHLLYKVLLLSTFSILSYGIIQSSPKISLMESDYTTIYNGINQTPQDKNLSWEEVLEQVNNKVRERIAAETAADKKLREAAADKKLREAAAAEKEKQRIAAEKEKQRIEEAERAAKAAAERAAKAAADKKLIEAEDEKQTYKYLSIFLFAVSILSVYLYNRNRKLQKDIEYLYNRKRKLQKDIEKQEKDISIVKEDLTKTKHELNKSNNINATINQKLIEQREIITVLESKLSDAHTKIRNAELKTQANREIIPTKEIQEIPKVVEKFYMSIPSSDGSFSTDSKHTNYDPTSCYYEFEKTGNNLYEFVLIDEAAPKALKYPDKAIDPVCDSIEGSSWSNQKIITVTKGKAELDGSMFRVIEKSQIKYVG